MAKKTSGIGCIQKERKNCPPECFFYRDGTAQEVDAGVRGRGIDRRRARTELSSSSSSPRERQSALDQLGDA